MDGTTRMTLKEWLGEQPYHLALSSGFFGFFTHTGMLLALEEAKVPPPRQLSGSSAGALVAGMWAGGMAPTRLAEILFGLRRADFWDPRPGIGLLAGRLFHELLAGLLPSSFTACRSPVAISVFDALAGRTRVLTEGDLPRAVQASCTVPGLLQPVWIDGRPYFDGGLLDRPGLASISRGERVLAHHLVSHLPVLRPPRGAGMVTLVIDGVSRVGPFRLEQGQRAFKQAHAATLRALNEPVADGMVRVAARG